MVDVNLTEVWNRYQKALDSKPSKGAITDIDSLVDSVCDVPELLKYIDLLHEALLENE